MTKLLFILFSFSGFAAETDKCQLELFNHYLIIETVKSSDSFYVKTDCNKNVQNSLLDIINNTNGKIGQDQLITFLNEQNPQVEIQIQPEAITIKNLKNELSHLLHLENSLVITEVKSVNNANLLTSNERFYLSAECSNCSETGNKNIKISHGGNKTEWLSIRLKRKRNVLKVSDTINPFSPIELAKVEQEFLTVDDQDNLFTDLENLKFYKANKTLTIDSILKKDDISPITLVNYGDKVNVTVRSNNVTIKSHIIARGNGKINDVIEVFNPKSKKKFNAKIIGEGELIIEL